MALNLTVLCENTAGVSHVIAEFGWSVLIETDGVKILFDTGQSSSVCHNAAILGVDLSQIDKIVLSHSHFDHTGGLRQILLEMRKEIEVIAHPHVWAIRFNRHEEGDKFMGIPFQRQELENFGATFKLFTKPAKIADNIMTTGEIPMITDFEQKSIPLSGGSGRFIQDKTGLKTDNILDDQAIIINTEKGLVVVLGCAHRGIINTLYHAQQMTGVKKIYAVLGGAHLISEEEKRIRNTIKALKDLDVQKLGLCHCTGQLAIALMIREFGKRFFFCNAGATLDLL
jgi:7,8-dihydropterin-6-yl-methyl-4-(beta-D-ribofuranosyl)aminobenzene 5'-phosphate synthase